ncbi:hypothetical protein SAMN05720606_106264 [Paenibacillus polysaccharolyticus]|uniref:Uncharacterized protein n=1 Tax=Paenibacillus polysaccharolyticus TaxID=582692 RepID=A0A1G5H803_9BACL|nr:hypothetical protein SAMN05720606_106264 [Paenibacillus polysaccharolyticus]
MCFSEIRFLVIVTFPENQSCIMILNEAQNLRKDGPNPSIGYMNRDRLLYSKSFSTSLVVDNN